MAIPYRCGVVLALALTLSGALLPVQSSPAEESGITLSVSAAGGADGSGTREAPYRTLEEARDAIRKLRGNGSLPRGGVVVEVLPGRYELGQCVEFLEEDSGTGSAPIVYRSTESGGAVLSGAVAVSNWRPVADSTVRSLLVPEAQSEVVCADLPAGLPDPLPGFANGGCGYRGKPDYPIALFQGGERLQISRWPNDGFAKMGLCVGHHEKRGHVGTTYTDGVFVFESNRLERWKDEPDGWFDGLWFHHWADTKMALGEIDLEARTIALKNPERHSFGYKAGQQFFAFNMISEIDEPGEWAMDREARKVYLWPMEDVDAQPVFVATRDHLICLTDVGNVRFEGFVLEGCRETAVVAKNCQALTISGCTLRHTGSWGIEIDGGRDCRVVGCDLYDLGEGGIKATGGVRDTLEPGNHLIENNHIHHFGRIVSTYRPGAAVYGVGNRIRHNLIYEAQHQAIYFRGNDHLIEYNIVHDVCLHSSDAGAIYACTRDWSQRGTIIRHNLFHALGEGLDGTGCRAIYLDDMTSGTIVESNIVTMGDRGLNFGGGQDNLVTDNIAINCKESINLASRGIDSFARVNAAKGRESAQFRLLLRDEALFRGELWRGRYPRLLAPLEMDPIDAQNAHFNTIRGNVNVGGGKLTISNEKKVMRTCRVEDNVDLYEDPGFVDLASLDLRLRRDAPLFERLPDFKAPDFARMGMYDDPRRASGAVKFGPHVSRLSPIITPEARIEAERPKLVSVPGRRVEIQVDGTLAESEWPESDSLELNVSFGATGEGQMPVPSRVWFRTDETHLFVGLDHALAMGKKATTGATWGEDDGFELVLAPALDDRLPSRLEGVVLRGYANGVLDVVEGEEALADAAADGAKVVYATNTSGKKGWTAEMAIPLQVVRVESDDTNFPVYCHVTAFKAAGKQWVTDRERWSLDSSDAKCASVLWLRLFGAIPFMPGVPASAIRIDVQGDRNAKKSSMQPVEGIEAPDWAVKWNRLVGTFGTARTDHWKEFRFEFMPLEDATVSLEVMGTQSRPGEVVVWTYYDNFRVEGAELANPDFEEVDANGKGIGWSCGGDRSSGNYAEVVDLGAEAASGKRAAKTSHDIRVSQRFDIRKGRKVIVTFQAKGVLPK